jgi:glycerophosphoryl diester phosphodiesterase
VRTTADQWSVRQTAAATISSQVDQPRRLRVVVRDSHVQGFLDGQLLVESAYCVDRPAGCVGLGVSGCVAAFDNFSLRRLPETVAVDIQPLPHCDNVAHRGFSAVAPENTLAAVREAIEAGASGCEFDVYGCGDGTVVLMHDKTVNRTTDGTGSVTELTLDQLRQLDAGSWKHARYAGERVPTLTEALRLLKDSDCRPVIEIKMEGISERVIQDVRDLEMVDQVAVIAFSQNVVREIREMEPNLPCAWLSGERLEGTPAQRADWLATRARECGTNLVDLNYKMLSPELVAELKRRDLTVWTWTVDEAPVMRALRQWGVASITTNRPDLLATQLR